MSRMHQSGFQLRVSPTDRPLTDRTPTLFLSLVLTSVLTMRLHANDSSYDTIRFFTSAGKPEEIMASALSPDGRYLALSFSNQNRGARSGISIVDLTNMTLLGTYGKHTYFGLAFSSDSTTVMAIGNYAGTRRLDIRSGQIREIRDPSFAIGRVGIQLEKRNGKLLVKQLLPEFNPTLAGSLDVGDEIVAYNEGPKATRYDDSREWKSLLGKSIDDANDVISGSPDTWLQLRMQRRGTVKPIEATIQRRWPPGFDRQIPDQAESLIMGRYERGEHVFRSADTGRECAFASLRDTSQNGRGTVSPDGRKYARIGRVRNSRKFCVEVHSMEKGVVEASVLLDAFNFRDMHFTADSTRVLVGTRDTVEVLNLPDATWGAPISLTPQEDRDGGRTVTRRIPLGLGLPGDFFTTRQDVVFSKPAALSLFAVSESGVLAIGSETGDIVLIDLASRERIGVVGEKVLASAPQLVRFTRGDGHLVAYASGVVHLFEFGKLQPLRGERQEARRPTQQKTAMP